MRRRMMEDLERVIETVPDQLGALVLLGEEEARAWRDEVKNYRDVDHQADRFDRASQALVRATEIAPGKAHSWRILADLHRERGRIRIGAPEQVSRTGERSRRDPEVILAVREGWRDLSDRSIGFREKALAGHPNSVRLLLEIARAWRELAHFEKIAKERIPEVVLEIPGGDARSEARKYYQRARESSHAAIRRYDRLGAREQAEVEAFLAGGD